MGPEKLQVLNIRPGNTGTQWDAHNSKSYAEACPDELVQTEKSKKGERQREQRKTFKF